MRSLSNACGAALSSCTVPAGVASDYRLFYTDNLRPLISQITTNSTDRLLRIAPWIFWLRPPWREAGPGECPVRGRACYSRSAVAPSHRELSSHASVSSLALECFANEYIPIRFQPAAARTICSRLRTRHTLPSDRFTVPWWHDKQYPLLLQVRN